MKKQLITGTLALSILISGVATFAENKVDETLKEDTIAVEVEYNKVLDLSNIKTYDKDGTKMVPIRQVAEGILGLEVKWINETQSVEIGSGPQWTSIKIGENSYFFARVAPFKLSQAPEIKDGLTYVPVEFFSEVLKYEIESEVRVPEVEEQVLSGFIKDIELDGSKRILVAGDESTTLFDEVLLYLTDETIIVGTDEKEFKLEDLKVGTKIKTVLPQIMTASLPPQGAAIKIIVENTDVYIEKVIDKDNEKIKYPAIIGIEEEIKDKINNRIEGFIKEIKENDLFKDLKLDYEINLLTDDKMSITFIGIYDFYDAERSLVRSINFDLKSANEINFGNYFKEDEKSQEKLVDVLSKAAKEQLNMEFEAEGKQIFFKGSKVVVFYYPLDDTVIYPVYLYIPLEDITDLVN